VRRTMIAMASLGVALGAIGIAPMVSADQVWHQAFGRTSANSTCPNPSAEDVASGWTQWAASWEQWPNGGNGGYTCTRSITWAQDSTGAGCAQVQMNINQVTALWGNFGNGYFLPYQSTSFIDQACSVSSGYWNADIVFATDHTLAAQRCAAAVPGTVASRLNFLAPNIYICDVPV
jgi:hypothetical protein